MVRPEGSLNSQVSHRTDMEKGLMEVKVMGIVVDPKASNPVVVLVDLSGQKLCRYGLEYSKQKPFQEASRMR